VHEQGPGVDEVGVLPWQLVRGKRFVRKVARRIGLNRAWATLIVVLAGLFAVSATITVLVVSLDTIATDLNSETSTINWALTGPMLAFGVVGPAFGKAGDLWGHKRLFLLGLLGAAVFAALTAVAWNAATMILFRTLSATAGSATGPAAMAFINRMFEPHERVRPFASWSFVSAGAPVLGVVAGVPLVETVGWRVIFLAQAPLCVAGALLAWWLLRDTEKQPGVRFDSTGALTLGVGAALILLGVNRGSAWGWASPGIIASLTCGVALLAMFVIVERRVDAPMVPPRWFRTRNVAFPVMSISLNNFGYMGGFILVPQMLDKGIGLSLETIGWLIIARPLTFALAAPLAARVTIRTGERFAGMFGSMTVFTSLIVLSTVRETSPLWVIALGLGFAGLGLGVASPAMSALLANAVDDSEMGTASAMHQLMAQIGALLGAAVMISVHEATLNQGILPSYSNALVIGAALCVVAGLLAGEVRSTKR